LDADLERWTGALIAPTAAYEKLCAGIGTKTLAEWDARDYKVEFQSGQWSSPFTVQRRGASLMP
jgi:hypothetical protein